MSFSSWNGILVLSVEQVLTVLGQARSQASDPVAVLTSYMNFYDQRGGLETFLEGDEGGLGLTKRNKKCFEARHMVLLLDSLAHNIVALAHRWLVVPQCRPCGILRFVRDVFHICGFVCFDVMGSVMEVVLNQGARLAHVLIRSVRALLAPLHIVVSLGET